MCHLAIDFNYQGTIDFNYQGTMKNARWNLAQNHSGHEKKKGEI